MRIRPRLTDVGSNICGCIWIACVYVKIYCLLLSMRRTTEIQENSLHGRAKSTRSSTDITFLIIVLCTICYSPFFISVGAIYFGYLKGNNLTVNYTWTALLGNSLLNPICYCLKNKNIKKGFVKFWKARCCKSNAIVML